MAKTLTNTRVYGDLASAVWVGPLGSTGPTTLVAATTPYVELGWLSDKGIQHSRKISSSSFYAYQGATLVRTKKTSVEDTFMIQCLEETAVVSGLYYAGQIPVVTTGVAKTTITNQSASDPRSWVIDEFDGLVQTRWVIPRAEVSDVGDIVATNADLTVYELTLTVSGDYFKYTSSPGMLV